MNQEHLVFCASDEWRAAVQDYILPWVLDDVDLGSDVIVGSGPGLTTDALRARVPRLTAVELDVDLAPGGVVALSDSLASDDLRTFHDGDTYNPVDSTTLPARLTGAGFTAVDVQTNEYGWMAHARKP